MTDDVGSVQEAIDLVAVALRDLVDVVERQREINEQQDQDIVALWAEVKAHAEELKTRTQSDD